MSGQICERRSTLIGTTSMTSDVLRHDLIPGQLRAWTVTGALFVVVEVEGVRCDLLQDGKIDRRYAGFVSRNSEIVVESA